MKYEQGDIVSFEGLKGHFLVVSKNFFNETEQAIICPIINDTFLDPLHIAIEIKDIKGIVMCEQMRLVDLRYRGFKVIEHLNYTDIINITDAIQSIFDY